MAVDRAFAERWRTLPDFGPPEGEPKLCPFAERYRDWAQALCAPLKERPGVAWHDFRRGVPLVVLDLYGEVINNFLDKLSRLPAEIQQRVARRIVYVDTAGLAGRVVPFPLLYRLGLGPESLETIGQRHLE